MISELWKVNVKLGKRSIIFHIFYSTLSSKSLFANEEVSLLQFWLDKSSNWWIRSREAEEKAEQKKEEKETQEEEEEEEGEEEAEEEDDEGKKSILRAKPLFIS